VHKKKIGLTAALSAVNQIENQISKRASLFSVFSRTLPQAPYEPITSMMKNHLH
jgi:hypothetical protein